MVALKKQFDLHINKQRKSIAISDFAPASHHTDFVPICFSLHRAPGYDWRLFLLLLWSSHEIEVSASAHCLIHRLLSLKTPKAQKDLIAVLNAQQNPGLTEVSDSFCRARISEMGLYLHRAVGSCSYTRSLHQTHPASCPEYLSTPSSASPRVMGVLCHLLHHWTKQH